MSDLKNPAFIAIARIARARGIRGEVLADLYTDYPERFDDLEDVWLEKDGGQGRTRYKLEDTWEHKGRKVLKFAGIDTLTDAGPLAGCWVMIPAEQAVPLPEGTYFNHDLVGCAVVDIHGNPVGTLTEVLDIAGNAQFVVRDESREYLIPAVDNICVKISIAEKQIIIDPPAGLMDLGQ